MSSKTIRRPTDLVSAHVVVDPVEGLRDRLLPLAELALALGRLHRGLPALGLGPVGDDVLLAGPEADGDARRVGCAEGRRLRDHREHHLGVEDVGLELHEQIVGGHAAVDPQLLQLDTRIGLHGVQDLARLEGRRLQSRACDVRLRVVARHADDRSARVAAPVRGEQAGEGRDEVHAAVVVDAGGQGLDVGGRGDDLQVVAQPLDERAGDRDRAFEGVHGGLVADLVADGGDEPVVRKLRLGAGVHEHEAAGSVGVLRHAGLEACLAEGGRLLVAQVAGDRLARKQAGLASVSVHLGGGADLGQERGRDARDLADVLAPLQGPQVHEHRARGVRDVGDVDTAVDAARQVPDEPRVRVSEGQFAAFGPFAHARHVLEDPHDFRDRGVGREGLTHGGAEPVGAAVGGEAVDDVLGAGVLPNDGVVDGLAGGAVPDDRRLALVGDAHRRDFVVVGLGPAQRHSDRLADVVPDLHGIVLDPPRVGEDLLVLELAHGNDFSRVVEEDRPGGCRSLVDSKDVLPFGISHL